MPQQYGAPAPQPEKKHGFAKIAGLGCLGLIALVVVIGVVAALGGGDSTTPTAAAPSGTLTSSAGPAANEADTKACSR